MPGVLYIIATPIGNLEDISYRAVRLLREVDRIAAEDTRHTRKLLQHYQIATPLVSYYDHNQELQGGKILDMLSQGQSIALVSDAGTPCIADPGYCLVRDARAAGITVVPVPGPNAAITTLSAAGFPTDQFSFAGFPPAKEAKRRAFLRDILPLPGTIVLYEAPHRIADTIQEIMQLFGPDQQIALGRELTKLHEEIVTGTAAQLHADLVNSERERGEFVLLIAPTRATIDRQTEHDTVDQLLRERLAAGVRLKEAVAQVAAATGLNRKELYARALALAGSDQPSEGDTP